MKPLFNLPACAAALLLSCLVSVAADPPKPIRPDPKPKPSADATKDSDPWQRRLPEFQSDNLPLSEVANSLADFFPEINFVLHPAVKDIAVSLKLRAVTLEDIFIALDIGTQNAGQAIDPNTGLSSQIAVQANKLNDRMVSFTFRQTPLPETAKPVCRAFSLGRYLAGKSEDEAAKALVEVEQALDTCWAMLQEADGTSAKISAPRLSLHRGTKLLIVVGQPSQVEVVEQVISQLESDGERACNPARGASAGPATGAGEAARAFAERYGLTPLPTSSASTNATPGRR